MSLGHGQSVELIADIFNLPNFLTSDWGIDRVGTFFGNFPLLQVCDDEATRWRMQLGARYHF